MRADSAIVNPTSSRYGTVVLRRALDRVNDSTRGTRHTTIFKAAITVGRYTAGGEINPDVARAQLTAAATAVLPTSDAIRQITRGLNYGARYPAAAPNRPRVLHPADARATAITWTGTVMASTEDPTVKSLLFAIGTACIRHARYETSLSHRQLAETAGVALSTVTAHLADLDRWTVRQPAPVEGHATTWRLLPVPAGHPTRADIPGDDPADNYWHKRAAWWLLYTLLDPDEPATCVDLARQVGRSLRTVYHMVRTMIRDGILERVDGAIRRLPDVGLPGTEEDWRTRRAERHAADRAGYERHLLATQEDRAFLDGLPPARRLAVIRHRRAARHRARLRGRIGDFERRRSGKVLGTVHFDPPATIAG